MHCSTTTDHDGAVAGAFPSHGAPPAGVVLLAAGSGRRLSAITRHTHKSLLPVAGKPALQYAIDEILARGVHDIVVVTGDKREAIERFVSDRYGARVSLTFNAHHASDTNILSTQLGVLALGRSEAGYMIVETDLVMEPAAWEVVLRVGDGRESFWVTHGAYSQTLTGGALRADQEDRVVELVYAPRYEAKHDGWRKLVGVLYVGSDQVERDCELRQRGIARTIAQYYMTPWVEHLALLPCRARSLGDMFAASFNDLEGYRWASQRFEAIQRLSEGSP
ncbi:MAG: NTP transferase domain-containing protein [Polyangiaceae bacterium]|nr:NTP transferase domain-containing protein [Polyangiaceae bacterium]